MWLYGFGKGVVGPLLRILYRIRVEGLENLPAEGGVILCGNHFHAFDPVMMGIASPRPISFMAKQELFTMPLIRHLVQGLGAFPVKRGQPDRAALKHSVDLLQAGGCFGIFPEGTRNRSGKLRRAEPGTAYLAVKSGAPVIPVGISSTYRLFSPVVIRFGRPVDLEYVQEGKVSSAGLEAAGRAIMDAIAQQLEPSQQKAAAAGQ